MKYVVPPQGQLPPTLIFSFTQSEANPKNPEFIMFLHGSTVSLIST